MNSSRQIELHPSCETTKLSTPNGFATQTVSVSIGGDAIRLIVPVENAPSLTARTEQGGFASFPKTVTDGPYSAIVSITGESQSRDIRLSSLRATCPKVDLLPEGEVLIVASRCLRYRDGTHELNAQVFGSDGIIRRSFLLGDGIKHIQCDRNGKIWVGYSDEGVFGNFGWARGNVLGAAGLSCFSHNGYKMWDFAAPDGFDGIADCYALNVSNEGAWAYYYTGFPLAFIDTQWQARAWNTESSGARAFAIASENLLLYGGYSDRRTSCSLLRLGPTAAELVAQVFLAFPKPVDLTRAKVIGRGKELHVFSDDEWYRFSVESIG